MSILRYFLPIVLFFSSILFAQDNDEVRFWGCNDSDPQYLLNNQEVISKSDKSWNEILETYPPNIVVKLSEFIESLDDKSKALMLQQPAILRYLAEQFSEDTNEQVLHNFKISRNEYANLSCEIGLYGYVYNRVHKLTSTIKIKYDGELDQDKQYALLLLQGYINYCDFEHGACDEDGLPIGLNEILVLNNGAAYGTRVECVIDEQGNVLIPCIEGFNGISGFYDKYARVSFKDKRGVVDKDWNIVIPIEYEDVDRIITEDLAAVKNNGKWGFISTKTGKTVVDFIYDDVAPFWQGFSAVNTSGKETDFFDKGKWNFIDKKGNTLLDFTVDEIVGCNYFGGIEGDPSGNVYGFSSDGFVAVKKNNKVAVINTKGEIVLDWLHFRNEYNDLYCDYSKPLLPQLSKSWQKNELLGTPTGSNLTQSTYGSQPKEQAKQATEQPPASVQKPKENWSELYRLIKQR